ncbi:hypothetical protein ASF40_17365 [Microbacterium sp. Leaf288]|nr:hypothetical protein ASF40_17365 [Microbacterium sp. Leaf288]
MRQERTEERRIALQNRWYVGGLAAIVASSLVFSGMSPASAEEVTTPDPAATTEATTTDTTSTDAAPPPPAEEPAAEEPAVEEPAAPADPPAAAPETTAPEATAPEATAPEGDATAPLSLMAAPQQQIGALAVACNLNGTFEIDANYAPGTCGGNDWTNVNHDEATQGGTYQTSNKDDSDPANWTSSGSTPPKGDFARVYSYAESVGGNYYLDFAWERSQEEGTGGYLIEVTNAGASTAPDGTPRPNRTNGGVLFVITTQGGGAPILYETCTYTSVATYPGTCIAYDGSGFISTVNDAAIVNPHGETVPAGSFFEIGINVTDLTNGGVKPGCPAPSAATAYMRSFTGNIDSDSKNLKGYIEPLTVAPPSTCVPLTATKTATPSFVRDYNWEIDKSVDQNSAKVRPGENAEFDYTVKVTPSAPIDSGFTVTGTIHVTNTNPVDVPITGVTDAIPGATCSIVGSQTPTVPKNGGSVDIAYTCSLPSGSAGTNKATVTWGSTAIPAGSAEATAGFTFAGLAPSTTTDASVTVSDTAAEFGGTKTVTKLDGPTTFTYSRQLGSDVGAGQCKSYDNTASIAATSNQPKLSDSVSVSVCAGEDLTITKNVVLDLTRTYAWDIDKSVDKTVRTVDAEGNATFDYTVKVTPGAATDSDWAMSGEITVANPNAWDVKATVTDLPSFPDVSCTVTGGVDATVPADSSKVFPYTCTFSGTGPFFSGTNKAKVTWNAAEAYSAHSSAEYTAQITELSWDKTLVNETITVIDDKTNPANPVTLGTVTWNANGTPTLFTYSITIPGTPGKCVDYTNKAWIKETGQNDKVTVTVCDYADLTVTKTANPTFKRAYAFDIDKKAAATHLVVDPQTGKATAHYTVTVTDGAAVDSDFKVSGAITVTNPNAVDVPLESLTDKIGGVTCTLNLPAELEVPANDSIIVQYSCALPGSTAATEGTNVASVTWDEEELLGTSGAASGSKAFSFANAVITDVNAKTITVLDDKTDPDADPVELGQHTWTAKGAKEEFTYSLELQGTPGACVEYTNTAWIEQTGQSDDETVELCAFQDLTVSKTAVGSFDRDYDWSITKVVDHDSATILPGTSEIVEYKVTVTPTAAQDSNFKVAGSISVQNPNNADVTITLADVLPGGHCVVTGIGDLTVEAGTTSVYPYTCSLPAATASTSVTNKADITWNANLLPGTSGAASGTAVVNFAQVTPATTDATATVSDTANEFGQPVVLNAADGAKEFTYERELSTPDGVCTTYPNTAKVVPSHESPHSASQSVEVCAPTIVKVAESAIQSDDDPDLWDVSYLITVNLAGGDHEYDLGDDPAFAPGVEILSGSAQRIEPEPAGPVINGIPSDGTPFVTGVAIGDQGNTEHVYRVVWHVRIASQIPAEDRACNGEDTGFFNTGILTVDELVQDSTACIPIVEKVYPVVRKTVTGLSRDAETKQWEIVYKLEVELAGKDNGNPAELKSKYNLSDTLQYGVIDIVDASWSGEGTTDEPFDENAGVWSADIASNKVINAGAIHTYTVTVHATLEASDFQSRTVGCTVVGQNRGLGFFNSAELSFSEDVAPQVVEACTPPVYPTVTKTASGTVRDPETGLQRVSYLVKVTSPAPVEGNPVTNVLYSLTEKPDALPDHVELVGTWHAEPVGPDTPSVTQATWDGTGQWLLKGVGVFSAEDRSAGKLEHVYRIWADLRVTGDPVAELQPCTPGDTEGIPIWNAVSLTFAEQVSGDVRACNEVNYDDVSIVKTSQGVPTPEGSETPSVEPGTQFDYVLTVKNNGTRAATNVVVTDPIPARLQVTNVVLPAGWINVNAPALVGANNTLKASVPSLGVGQTAVITVTVKLTPTPVGPVVPGDGTQQPAVPLENLVNTACVAATLDQVPENNCSTVEIPVREITAVVYTKCVADAPFLGWTIRKSATLLGSEIDFLWTPDEGGDTTVPPDVAITQPGGTATWSDEIEWPGAEFTPSGVSIDYPGWRPIRASDIVPGSSPTQYYYPGTTDIIAPEDVNDYVFNGLILDDSELDYTWRLGSTVTFTVNPELAFAVEYPEATPGCAVARHSNVQIEKTASVEKTDPGASFTYSIAVQNVSDDSAAEAVVVTDAIPADIKITNVTWTGKGDDTVFPNWQSCEVTGQNGSGYGGTLTCVLFGPLQPQGANEGASAAPTITLAATVNPGSKASSITNVAVVDYHTFGNPDDKGRDSDDAIVLLSALPATGGELPPLLVLLGLLALLGGTTMLIVTRRRRGEVKATI